MPEAAAGVAAVAAALAVVAVAAAAAAAVLMGARGFGGTTEGRKWGFLGSAQGVPYTALMCLNSTFLA
eukprot:4438045-Pyramimonas_sp.AAC.1